MPAVLVQNPFRCQWWLQLLSPELILPIYRGMARLSWHSSVAEWLTVHLPRLEQSVKHQPQPIYNTSVQQASPSIHNQICGAGKQVHKQSG